MGDHDDWDFDGDEGPPQEFAAEASVPAPLPRDANGKIVRADWSGGPPDEQGELALSEQAAFTLAEKAEMRGEAGTDVVTSYDELPADLQAFYVNEEGYANVQATQADLQARDPAAFDRMTEDRDGQLPDVQIALEQLKAARAFMSDEALVDYYDGLRYDMPLEASAALHEYLVKHKAIKV